MKQIRAVWTNDKGAILAFLAIFCVCLLRFVLGLPCPIQYTVGISCPGCGMTRALWSLATLDFSAALYYHPVCFALPVFVAFLILFKAKGMKRSATVLLAVLISLLLAVYVWRLSDGNNDAVVCAPQNGLIARFIRHIASLLP